MLPRLLSRRRATQPPEPAPPPPQWRPSPASSSQAPPRRICRALAIVGLGLVAARASGVWVWVRPTVDRGGVSAPTNSWNRPPSRRLLPPRFPCYGSREFAAACPWIDDAPLLADNNATSVDSNITSIVPWAVRTEGLAPWACAVAQAYIYAHRLARTHRRPPPRLLLEFKGKGVNITEVVRPPEARRHNSGWAAAPPRTKGLRQRESASYHWCKDDPNCRPIDEQMGGYPQKGVVPLYRNTYAYNPHLRKSWEKWVREGEYDDLKRAIPGFSVETGMACALNALWEPSPSLAEHEPGFFTHLLPELRRDDTLVIALYLRTGWADLRISGEKSERTNLWDESAEEEIWKQKADEFLRSFVECAQQLEREYFANYTVSNPNDAQSVGENAAFSKIAWMISSDSPLLKQYVRDGFHGRNVDMAAGRNGTSTFAVPRRVVFTGAKGVHTRADSEFNHTDAAQAFVDWYLLGESDAVVSLDTFSFGNTAALRTARPVYSISAKKSPRKNMGACKRHPLVLDK